MWESRLKAKGLRSGGIMTARLLFKACKEAMTTEDHYQRGKLGVLFYRGNGSEVIIFHMTATQWSC